jgi:site-specific DNA-cytosine methylase
MPSESLNFIDLFAGAGGLSEGLTEAGFHGLYANEVMAEYAQTYKKNHPETEVMTADVRTIDPVVIRQGLGLEREQLDLMAGGPPCQGFSINMSRTGRLLSARPPACNRSLITSCLQERRLSSLPKWAMPFLHCWQMRLG